MKEALLRLLPLIAVVLIESTLRFSAWEHGLYGESGPKKAYILVFIQLLLESLPLFGAQLYVLRANNRKMPFYLHKSVIWLSGFLFYPLLNFYLLTKLSLHSYWALFNLQAWLLLVSASIGSLFMCRFNAQASNIWLSALKRIATLNSAVFITLVVWSFMIAGVFLNEADPMRNQPLPMVIDTSLIVEDFGRFSAYFIQFFILGLCCVAIYGLNRYVLIRKLLAENGVFSFLSGVIISIIIITPVFANIILAMPINVPEQTLLPSEDHNPYSPINYQVVFWVFVFSTPVILAFERQQHGKVLAQIKGERIQSELQLLQQQVNPHFLFNTLNNLYSLVLSKSDKAPEMVLKLSDLLRYTVYEGQKDLVPLTQEITYLQNYLSLQRLRYGNNCTIESQFPNANHWLIPPLLMIVLIENGFKHGVERIAQKGYLSLEISIDDDVLTLDCVNTIPCDTDEGGAGMGLANLRRRLQLLQPTTFQLSVGRVSNVEWKSTLKLRLTPC